MLQKFKITSYAFILCLFSFTALDAADSIPACPSNKTYDTIVVVGSVGPHTDLITGVEPLAGASYTACYNFDNFEAFKIVKNNVDLTSFHTNYAPDVLTHAEDCTTPGVICRWVDPHPRGVCMTTNYAGEYMADGSPAPKLCLCPIQFRKCIKTPGQSIMKRGLKRQRGPFSGKR